MRFQIAWDAFNASSGSVGTQERRGCAELPGCRTFQCALVSSQLPQPHFEALIGGVNNFGASAFANCLGCIPMYLWVQ